MAWREVKSGESLPMMQGMALNMLANKYHPDKLEWNGLSHYRVTKGEQVATYHDTGIGLEIVPSQSRNIA